MFFKRRQNWPHIICELMVVPINRGKFFPKKIKLPRSLQRHSELMQRYTECFP